jgi:type IV secretion system protein VirD4
VLGHMRVIESAAGQMAGFGVKLWVILQDLGQLQNHYEKSWETFLGNAAVATFQSISDLTTLKYLSERLGTRTFYMPIESGVGIRAKMDGAKSENETVQTAPLLATHEIEYVLARERGAMIVLFSGMHPLILQRAISYDDPYFVELLK